MPRGGSGTVGLWQNKAEQNKADRRNEAKQNKAAQNEADWQNEAKQNKADRRNEANGRNDRQPTARTTAVSPTVREEKTKDTVSCFRPVDSLYLQAAQNRT